MEGKKKRKRKSFAFSSFQRAPASFGSWKLPPITQLLASVVTSPISFFDLLPPSYKDRGDYDPPA